MSGVDSTMTGGKSDSYMENGSGKILPSRRRTIPGLTQEVAEEFVVATYTFIM